MKRNGAVFFMTVAAALAIIGCHDPVKPNASADKITTTEVWEYKVQRVYLAIGNPEALRLALNNEGGEGWELVSVTPLDPIENNYSGSPTALGIFKRVKR